MRQKGQESVEYLTIIIVLLLIVGMIFVYALDLSQRTIMMEKTKNAVKELANVADLVYASGPGSKMYAEIELPANIEEQILEENELGYKLRIGNAITDIYEETRAKLTGELPTAEGTHIIALEMLESGFIRIGSGLILTPSRVAETVLPGNGASSMLTAWNSTSESLTGITNSKSGSIAPFTTLGSISETLDVNASDAFDALFSIPSGTASATYSGYINVDSNQGTGDRSLVQIFVPQVLTNLDIYMYSDSSYSQHSAGFGINATVYFELLAYDQSGKGVSLTDLNIFIKNPSGTDVNVFRNQSAPNGRYLGTFKVPCNGALGPWTILANGKAYSAVSDSNNFTVSGVQQKDYFEFDWSTAGFASAGKDLVDWTIRNIGCSAVTVADMNVAWLNDADGANLKVIRIDNTQIWNGTSPGNVFLNVDDYNLAAGSAYGANNKLEYDKAVNDDLEQFIVTFRFGDASTYTTPTYYASGVPDATPPVILLESPDNNATDADGNVQFDYNVGDDSNVSSCELILDGSSEQTDSSITKGITQSFIKTGLASSDYVWDVNCTDAYANEGSASDRNIGIRLPSAPVTVTLWAQNICDWGNCDSTANVTGAADNAYDSTNQKSLGGYNFNVSGLSGTITNVKILWSHQIPEALGDDTVHLHYGLASYDQNLAVFYSMGGENSPVDKMNTNAALIESRDVTAYRPGSGAWAWGDFANLKVGGDYVRRTGANTSWRLDAVGAQITYIP